MTLTNPTSSDALNSPSHSALHIATNNAIDSLHYRYSGSHADDDEFLGTSLGGAWTAVTPTGTATWTVGNNTLSVLNSGTSANDICCQLKSMTDATTTVTIETALRMLANTSQNWNMAGLVFADGTSTTSNAVAFITYFGGGSQFAEIWSGTLTNMATTSLASFYAAAEPFGRSHLFLQMKWTASNTWQAFVSPDGVSWTRFTAGNATATLSPTKYGVFVSKWGGASDLIASFEYFRVTKT